jgi:hypothetical protein
LVLETLALALNGALVTLLLLVGGSLSIRDRALGVWTVVTLGIAAALLAVVLIRFPAREIPVDWITVLSEGTGKRNVLHVFGEGVRAGPGFSALTGLVTRPDVLPIRSVVHLNVCLTLVNGALYFLVARQVLKSALGAFVLLALFVASPMLRFSALSELPSQLIGLYLLSSVVGAFGLRSEHQTTSRLAFALLFVSTVLVALTRVEVAVLGAGALAIGALHVRSGPAAVSALERRLIELLRRLWKLPWWQHALWIAAFLVLERAFSGRLAWAIAGVSPANFSFVLFPFFAASVVPIPALVLFLLGVVHAVRHLFAFLLLPITLLVLYRVFHVASHGVAFEMLRYGSMLLPVMMVLAPFGWRELRWFAQRRGWSDRWRPYSIVVLGLATIVGRPHGARDLVPMWRLERDQQRDVRALVSSIEHHPSCAIVTRVQREDHDVGARASWDFMVFGARYRDVRALSAGDLTPEGAASIAAPDAACVLFHHGLDCNRLAADCRSALGPARELYLDRHASSPYSDVDEYGAHRPVIELGLYALKGEAQ